MTIIFIEWIGAEIIIFSLYKEETKKNEKKKTHSEWVWLG